MDTFRSLLVVILFIIQAYKSVSQCLNGCSCTTDRHGRSLVCMEENAFGVTPDIPADITKVRIEKSHFTEIPRGAFRKSPALENLWLNFNHITLINSKGLEGLGNLTELRLEGNNLRSVPWTAFEDTPALKILDLKHNQLDVLPEHALKFLPSLTYLDLSSNRLTVISREVFLNWPLYQNIQSASGGGGAAGGGPGGGSVTGLGSNVVLALHDNPWLCDCRLRGFVAFVRAISPPMILMNSYLTCSGPDFRAGKFFHEVELEECLKPAVSTPSVNLSMPLGRNVTLHCLARARPEPAVWWTYGLKIIRGFHESQERVDEDTVRSRLVIPSLHGTDRGIYTCSAINFMGNSSVSILLEVQSVAGASQAPQPPPGFRAPPATAQENAYIDLRIARQMIRGISIEWYAVLDRPSETWFTVHFGRVDSPKREATYVGPGTNSYTVSDLMPATKYEICVTLKNQEPRAGQCIVFVTGSDVTEMEQRQKLIHIVVIVLAMVLAVPAGMYACTTDRRLNCDCVTAPWKRCRRGAAGGGSGMADRERQGTFDSLQAGSEDGLVNTESSQDWKVRRRSDDRLPKGKTEQSRITAELY